MGNGTTSSLRAGRVARAFQPLTVLGEQLVVGVARIRLGAEDDDAGPHEPADVVDVAVGVVAHDAPAEPDHLADAEAVGEGALDLGSGEARISRLLVRQEAFLGREQRALAVDVDRPALENDAPPRDRDGSREGASRFRDGRGDPRIAAMVGVLGPPVEAPDRGRDGAVRPVDEDRAGVAHPAPVGRDAVELDPIEVDLEALENSAGTFFGRRVADQDRGGLAAREGSDDLAEAPGDGGEATRPVGSMMGPGDPGRAVRLPLGGHDAGAAGLATADAHLGGTDRRSGLRRPAGARSACHRGSSRRSTIGP